MLGVYIHIPFCERKCLYCAFSSFVNKKDEGESYLSHLLKEINNFENKNNEEVDSIYIGGGTPSLLELEELDRIFKKLHEKFKISSDCEISIECNPNSLTKEKLLGYKRFGINRLSIGVQSLNDEDLKFIARLHNRAMAIDAVKKAKECGFENINCDLLIGLKNANTEDFLNQLKTLLDLGVTHISAYMLQVEDGTPLQNLVKQNADLLPSDDECVEIYEKATKYLQKYGFNKYEISNFALKGYECKHNLKYWSGENYIGFGLSAHSYIDGIRFANSNNFKDYYAQKLALKEKLTTKQLIEEHIMLGLRCYLGVDLDYLKSLNYNLEKNENLIYFLEKNIIYRENNRIFLNQDYYGINNYVIIKLMP